MKSPLILAALAAISLTSCVTTTAPDGTKTTRVDIDAFKIGADTVKAYAPVREVVPEK